MKPKMNPKQNTPRMLRSRAVFASDAMTFACCASISGGNKPLPIDGGGGGMKGWFGGVDDTARASSGQGWWSFTANNRDILIQLRQFDAGVIRFENLFDVESLLRQAVGGGSRRVINTAEP